MHPLSVNGNLDLGEAAGRRCSHGRGNRLSKTIATGVRVPLNTQAPLTLPGMLSTAGHWDQSSEAIG
jgi:hypothetical protein